MALSQLFAFIDMKETLVKNRVSLLLLVFACLLALAPAASAQTDCLNLAASDCEILTAAEANSENMKSAQLNFAFDFSLGGLEAFAPEAAGGVEFHVSGGGPFTSTGVPDPSVLMSGDAGAFLSLINTQMDLNIDVTVPGEDPFSSPFSFVIVDGTLYFSDPDSGQWVGMTGETVSQLAEQSMGMMSAMGGAGGVDPETLSDPTAMMGQLPPELLTALSSFDPEALAATPGFLNYQRLSDEDMMGQPMIPFQFTADFGALFQSTEFQSTVNQIIQAASQMDTTDPEAAQNAAMAAAFVPMILNGTTGTFNLTQWVGSSDQFIHQVAIDLQGAMDLSMLAAAAGEASSGQMSPITLDLHIQVSFDQINSAFSIAAPEGAQMLTPEMMGMSS
jgi:hypothetical protein